VGAVPNDRGGDPLTKVATETAPAESTSGIAVAPVERLCRFCGSRVQEPVIDLGPSPLSQSFLRRDQLDEMEPFYPLRVTVCRKCFLVQLPEFASPGDIFSDYAYFSSYSESWLEHARRYAERMIPELGLGRESLVVELASNDGYLLQHFVAREVPVLGIEPARNVAAAAVERGIPTTVAFFGTELADRLVSEGRRADLLVGNNVLAHVPNLNDFVSGMTQLLADTGLLTMEFPHLLQLLARNEFDTIYHEHFSYFSLQTAQRVFAAHGLTIVDVDELDTHGGSLRIHARHTASGPAVTNAVAALIERERLAGLDQMEPYQAFGGRIEGLKRELLEFLIGIRREGRAIAGYGAPAKANTLLNYCAIREDLLAYTVDRNPYKQGLFTPGTHIPVHAPEELARTRPEFIWILPWNLEHEILGQLDYARAWGAKFVVAVPELRVIP
jgi:C-methyltransferase-like protein/putative zinc binding protein/methyltransferase family protein